MLKVCVCVCFTAPFSQQLCSMSTQSGLSQESYEERSRRFSSQTRSQQYKHLQSVQVGVGSAWRRRQDVLYEFDSRAHVFVYINTSVGPDHQKPSTHIVSCKHTAPLFHSELFSSFFQFHLGRIVRNLINSPTCSHSAPLGNFKR